jgi:hypothetical protein
MVKIGRPSALDVSEATATGADVLSPKTFFAGEDPDIKVGTITEETDLSAVDADLATGNIKDGVTIFGVEGSNQVQDISGGDAVVADVLTGKKFFADSGSVKTGTMPQQSLSPDSEVVAAGKYAATTLSAVDVDLATANIKFGVTIFGKAGSTNVRDTVDANAAVGDVATGKTFYAGGGAKKTGTLESPGALTEDDIEIAHETGNSAAVADNDGCKADEGDITSDTDLDSAAITCNDPSLAFAVAFGNFCSENPEKHQIQLLMGGVVMGTSDYFSSSRNDNRSVIATRSMTGAITCKCRIKVSNGGGHLYYWGPGVWGQRPSMVAVGSVKH